MGLLPPLHFLPRMMMRRMNLMSRYHHHWRRTNHPSWRSDGLSNNNGGSWLRPVCLQCWFSVSYIVVSFRKLYDPLAVRLDKYCICAYSERIIQVPATRCRKQQHKSVARASILNKLARKPSLYCCRTVSVIRGCSNKSERISYKVTYAPLEFLL